MIPETINLTEIEQEDKKLHKQEIELPCLGKLISTFAQEVAAEVKDKNTLFYRVDSKEIIEIGTITIETEEGNKELTGFLSVKPNRFITITEKYFIPIKKFYNASTKEHFTKKRSMTIENANIVLASEILQKELPQITRLFTIPIPIMYKGELTFPTKGYDSRFNSWLPIDAPEIINPNMSLEEAKELFKTIFKDFCFEIQQDYYNAIAALLTPYLRGLFTKFNTRTPVFFYIANRERAGKDYCAGITGLIYEGNNIEEAPLCSGEKFGGGTSEELRKKLLSAFISGRKRMHFANNKGHIDNAVFEQITTAEQYTDRILGRNETLTFDNELDFSLSGNTGVTYTADVANRCRFVKLFLEIENANERKFTISDLHGFILENRGKILSALYCLVRNWKEKGSPKGSKPFASFHQWANVCGGIMEAAGYGNPCEIDKEIDKRLGDSETNDMKALFEECYDVMPEQKWNKDEIVNKVISDGLFEGLDLANKHGDLIKFSNLLKKYNNRILSDIRMEILNPKERLSRNGFKFTKEIRSRTLINFDGVDLNGKNN